MTHSTKAIDYTQRILKTIFMLTVDAYTIQKFVVIWSRMAKEIKFADELYTTILMNNASVKTRQQE